MNNHLKYFISLFTIAVAFQLMADEGTHKSKVAVKSMGDKDWTIELGTGALFGNNRFDDTRTGSANPDYTLIPIDLTATLAVDEVGLDNFWGGVFRGNTEFFFRGSSHIVTQGIEDHFVGFYVGPRYNFVQRGWKIIPFVESPVGVAFTNSQGESRNGLQVGQGQDFCFTFGIAGGVRYDIDDSWFLRLTMRYTHFSNAGLSEPGRENHGLDVIGPVVSFGRRF